MADQRTKGREGPDRNDAKWVAFGMCMGPEAGGIVNGRWGHRKRRAMGLWWYSRQAGEKKREVQRPQRRSFMQKQGSTEENEAKGKAGH